jgi:transcriptional regulator with GAF, ATPase, and Fis domain
VAGYVVETLASQEREFQRLGGTRLPKANLRIIGESNMLTWRRALVRA